MSRIIKEFDSDGTFLASYKSIEAAARANHVRDLTIYNSIKHCAVSKKLGKYFTVEYLSQPPKNAKNNCPACYYGHKLGADWACLYYYIKGVGNRRPCKVANCEIWRLSPKGTAPIPLTIKETPKKKDKLSKAQANHLTAIIMGEGFVPEIKRKPEIKRNPVCPACSKELDTDAVFCKYCGTKV